MNSATVLIVDDEIGILEIARRYLEHAGFVVLEARDGLTGLNLARAQQPDVIVLDVMLPKLDGWRACKGTPKACTMAWWIGNRRPWRWGVKSRG